MTLSPRRHSDHGDSMHCQVDLRVWCCVCTQGCVQSSVTEQTHLMALVPACDAFTCVFPACNALWFAYLHTVQLLCGSQNCAEWAAGFPCFFSDTLSHTHTYCIHM